VHRYITHTALIAAIAILSASCSAQTPPAEPTTRVILTVSGGIAGIEEVTEVHRDGAVVRPDGTTATGDPAAVVALFEIIDGDGVFAGDHQYLAQEPCCDRFTYSITVERSDGTVTIDTMDEADEPEVVAQALSAILRLSG